MLLAAVVPAFATIDCTNDTTGANSNNICTILAKKKVKLRIRNYGNVSNNIVLNSNTGNDSSDLNTGGGSVTTGQATASADPILTVLNDNVVNVTQACDDCLPGTGTNTFTGYASNNTVTVDTSKRVRLSIKNVGNVLNNVVVNANSGNSTSDKNTLGGLVVTGDATATGGVSTSLNTNLVTINQ